jgi:uncharacterized protein (DUF302 family)
MPAQQENGIVSHRSSHSVDDAVAKILRLLQDKAVTLFVLIDHRGEATKAGLQMRPTKLLIFGSPKAGTPLMLAAPSAAIDLPLKLLVSEDSAGEVWISYNAPEYLQRRYGFPADLLPQHRRRCRPGRKGGRLTSSVETARQRGTEECHS